MGIVKRQGIKGSIASYLGIILGYINVVLLFPNIFEPEQFGLTRVLLAISLVFAQFAQLGVSNTTIKFFPFFRNKKNKHHGFLTFALLLPFLGLMLTAMVFIFLKDQILSLYIEKSKLVIDYYYLIFPLIIFHLYYNILETYVRSLFRIAFPIFVREVVLRLFTTVIILLFFLKWITFSQFLFLFILFHGLIILILIGYIINLKQLLFGIRFDFLKIIPLKEILVYGLFALLSGGAWMMVTNIDIIMLSYLIGLKDTAIYTVAFFIATVIQIPQRNLSKIIVPIVSEAWKRNDLQQINELYKKTSLNQLIIGGFIFVGIWVNADGILKFLPEAYEEGKYVILFIALARLFDMATGINSEIIVTSKYYRFNLIILVTLILLSIISNYVLIPLYGINGAALATAISILLYNVIKSLYLWIKFKIQPFVWKSLTTIIIAIFSFLIANMIPELSNYIIEIIIRSLIVIIIFGSLILSLKVSSDINDSFNKLVKKILQV